GGVPRDALTRQRRFAIVEARLVGGPPRGPAPGLAVHDVGRLDDARHEDSRQIDQLGGDLAGLHDLVHLDDRGARGLGEARIEILAAAAELDVAEAVRAIASQQGVVDAYRVLEDVALAVELADLPSRREVGVDAGGRVERRNPGAARAAAFDQDALGDQLDLHLAGGDLLLAGGRRAGSHGERRDQLLHLVVLGEDLAAGRSGVTERVADEREVFRLLIAQGADQGRREAMRDAETGDGHRRPVGDVRDGLLGRSNDLVHAVLPEKCSGDTSRAGHTGSLYPSGTEGRAQRGGVSERRSTGPR